MHGKLLLGYLTTLFQMQMLHSIERQDDHECSITNKYERKLQWPDLWHKLEGLKKTISCGGGLEYLHRNPESR
jgi:hypothetical protein